MEMRENVPIAELTTMRLGGAARFVMEVSTPEEIPEVYAFARERNLPVWVMGGGANTIGHDAGFDGVILLNKISGIEAEVDGKWKDLNKIAPEDLGETLTIAAGAGEVWDDVVRITSELGYSGIEAMSAIPGTVGAAPVQNIGAYGQDMAQVVENVQTYDLQTGKMVTLKKSEMDLGYRHTRFNFGEDAGRFIITQVTLKLKKGELKPPFYNSLQARIDLYHETNFAPANIRRLVMEIRSEKLPDPKFVASAGSFFKNVLLDKLGADEAEARGIPVWRNADGSGKINSGWLIEQCGLKGAELYGFKVSDKAALVLINENAETYADLAKARSEIVAKVRKKFGFTLEQEPVEIPDNREK